MLGFEQTATGYKATDEQVAWWESRDTCPACGHRTYTVEMERQENFAEVVKFAEQVMLLGGPQQQIVKDLVEMLK